MTKRKAKRKTSDIQISPNSDRSGVTIEGINPEIVDEEPITIEPLAEPIPVPHEESTVEVIIGEKQKFINVILELPEPLFNPTQRQYGEDFLPAYVKVRARLRRLAGIP